MSLTKKNQVLVVVDANYLSVGFSDLAKQRKISNAKLDIAKLSSFLNTFSNNSDIVFKFWFDSSDNAKDNSKWKNLIEYHGFSFPHFEFKTMNVKAICPCCDHHFLVKRPVQAGVDSAITNIIQKRCIDDPRIDTLYLLAGDGDFQPIVEKVNNSLKTAHVFSFKDSFKASLKATAGAHFHLLDDSFDTLIMGTQNQEIPKFDSTDSNKKVLSDWNCPKCNDYQFARNDSCRKCGTKRTQIIKTPSSLDNLKHKREDWRCPQCNDFQFGRNKECRKCGFLKL
jgi:uncharacterized LabA/DUF88 family protein/predicted RNA-binding Zn-ribbon protein involved in translation (DUF1610 family)